MWRWIRRLRDWAMRDLLPGRRLSPQPQALHVSYEKAGLTLHDSPVPWNAEAVLVEALLRLPKGGRKADFQLRVAGREPLAPESLRRDDGDERHRLFFRLAPPPQTVMAELTWKTHSLGQLTVPVLAAGEFVSNLRLQMPTLFVRIGEQSVSCQTFVATQCKGLMASALISSPTSLAPLLDLGLRVEFRSERDNAAHEVPVPLCSSQLAGRQALVTVVPRKFPKRIGTWTATWKVGDQVLTVQKVRAISQRAFQRSLRVVDTRFVVDWGGGVQLRRQMPPLNEVRRVGPCFLVSSREPGMAGSCTLQVFAQVPGAVQSPLLLEQTALVTDGPTLFAPGTLEAADLGQVVAFELRNRADVLGVLSLCPVPTANFNAEGGFKPPPDFAWTHAAEEELNERLGRLMGGQ